MILTVDIGNTNVKIGLFDKGELCESFKMSTDVKRTSDEYAALLLQLLSHSKIGEADIGGAIVSSVIPQLDYTFTNVITHLFGVKPMIVGVGVKTGIAIKYENPRELGSDRIITCVAAEKKFGAPFILVDFGTATTFNVVNGKKEFIGGAISLGLKANIESLATCTAKLPSVELETPNKCVAQSTRKAIQSGVIFGAVGQVKYIIDRIKRETGLLNAQVIATGGLSNIVNDVEPLFDHIDRELSLKGLYEIYKLNV
ncbi:MAG: type III pantothenate kinase [Corallococcus sp.]|nr:type III pantothenate kinase [Corallococcus sp.]MCM1359255.1 type III pantothenate kinase [Corallococcus sp.]MCM1394646.1 type III pantothenate kinase [Corallococcus sp.]